jgi:hypothetical protein
MTCIAFLSYLGQPQCLSENLIANKRSRIEWLMIIRAAVGLSARMTKMAPWAKVLGQPAVMKLHPAVRASLLLARARAD